MDQWEEASAVDFFAMTDAKNQDQKAVVFELADQTVVTHAVFPELAETRAVQGLADTARIVQFGHAPREKLQDAPGLLRVELAEFAFCGLGKLNAVGHGASSLL